MLPERCRRMWEERFPVPADQSAPDSATFLASQDHTLYVPADPTDEWVWVREASRPVQTFGPASERAAAQPVPPPWDQTQVWRAPGGAFGQSVDPSMEGWRGLTTADEWRALPRDPARLLEHVRRQTAGQGVSADQSVLIWVADALSSGTVPAEVRASMYRALALVPGVTITDDRANLDGHTGVAIGRSDGDDSHLPARQEIIVDPATGQLIGERRVWLEQSGEVPAGTVTGWTAVRATVVARQAEHSARVGPRGGM